VEKEVINVVEMLSRKLARRHWSESAEDLIQDGMVLLLELYKKHPNADKEWIFKALHNFYSTKRKKITKYERRRVDLDDIPELGQDEAEEVYLDDMELEVIRYMVEELHLGKKEILNHIRTADRTLYDKLRKLGS